jgi:hypothetical protein
MFGPYGSGSVIYSSDPDPAINKQKNEEKHTVDCYVTFYDFLSLKDDVNVLSKINKHENVEKNNKFLLAS